MATTEASAPTAIRGQSRNLAAATVAFGISFWAWNVIAPLGVHYTELLSLSGGQKAFLVAIPVLVGSLGRIIAGALADKFGGRLMFTVLLALTAPFVILVGVAGAAASYPLLLIFGFLLGIAGTTFAVGIPFVNAWYPPAKRGMATGIFGAGMGGTAFSAFFTPRFVEWFGYFATHLIIAVAVLLGAAMCWFALRNAPSWRPSDLPVLPKIAGAARLAITWKMAFLYGICFGGFVAFSTYLPSYIKDVYSFNLTEAGTRTAIFAITAVIARPIGGALSDRLGPRQVVAISLAGTAILAVVVAFQPPPDLGSGSTFVLLALFLGLGTGGVFAWVAVLAPPDRVGSVTGVVGAVGGLGGFFPPLIMGATYQVLLPDYGFGLGLLTLLAAGGLAFTLLNRIDRA
ncbi:MFS transporter [Microlunatus soli]|uniref:MFS transporter, NNP family, nitrate/nitrite transporter n=1 Tax=Microlunatus soli TaxID=630515 RepID=A0A1H2AE40_9ACTN|nr:MFS transporter [Microlunatus soli]SDT44218.1 MFS transporter, NNP family, nitrate/nitrite transporter [Microlunatus soli]